jgi:hypothetical protein
LDPSRTTGHPADEPLAHGHEVGLGEGVADDPLVNGHGEGLLFAAVSHPAHGHVSDWVIGCVMEQTDVEELFPQSANGHTPAAGVHPVHDLDTD